MQIAKVSERAAQRSDNQTGITCMYCGSILAVLPASLLCLQCLKHQHVQHAVADSPMVGSPQIRQTASMSSNGDSISGTLARTLTRSRSDGASLNGALQRRASTTWCDAAAQLAR